MKLDPISVLKFPKDVAKITEIDWAASDRPVIACQDGTIKVYDMNLKTCSSSFDEFILSGNAITLGCEFINKIIF